MDSVNAPQIIEHQSTALDFTPYDTKWVPGSARYVLAGQTMKATGILKLFKLNQEQSELELTVAAAHPGQRRPGRQKHDFRRLSVRRPAPRDR